MPSLSRDLWQSFRHIRFWALSAWLDIMTNARMSRLGFLWLLLPSFLYIWGVGFIYSFIFHEPMSEFAVYVAVGTIVFRLITGTITHATSTFRGSKSYIMDGNVRLSDFVLRGISTTLFTFILSLPATIIAIAVYPGATWLGVALATVVFPLILINVLWVGVVFALIGARHPDFSHAVPNLFIFLYLATPIIWKASTIKSDSVRGHLMAVNPFYYLIEAVRAPIMSAHYDMRAVEFTLCLAVVGSALAIVAYRRWARFVPLWI